MGDEKEGTTGRTLYFGFDESNHAGPDRKGEIVTGVISRDHEDSIVKDYPNTRNYREADLWLSQKPTHDYRFTILTGDKYRYRSSSSNLVEAIPSLVDPFLNPNINCIKLYLDGRLSKGEKNFLRGHFSNIENVVIDNFIKRHPKKNSNFLRKGPRCPRVVYFADVLANMLLNQDAQSLLSHPKFIPR